MTPNELVALGDENFAVHAAWLAGRTSSMLVSRVADVLFIDSRFPSDTFNIVCCLQSSTSSPDTSIEYVCAYFAGVGRPFSWWVSSTGFPSSLHQQLCDQGLVAAELELAMMLNLESFEAPGDHPELRIERVANGEQLKAFASVIAANWDPSDINVLSYYRDVAEAVFHANCPVRLFVGYVGATPVATAEVTTSGGVAGVYSVATLKEYRRHGFATAIVAQALSSVKVEGFELAFLQSSKIVASVYARLGFEAYGVVTEYKPKTLQ